VELTELELEQTLYQGTTAVVPMAGQPPGEPGVRATISGLVESNAVTDFRPGRCPMIKRFAPWVFLLLLFCMPRSALSQTASITGTVKDSTGAAVPKAKITSHNRATSAARSTITDDSGIYRITSLPPGNYDVVIEKAGFKTVEYSSVVLTVDHVQNLDATLAPSSVTEKVTVTGESVLPSI